MNGRMSKLKKSKIIGIISCMGPEVPTLSYAPWAIICYLGFIIAWIYGYTGKAIWKEKNKSEEVQ